jgi:hypothetical protein
MPRARRDQCPARVKACSLLPGAQEAIYMIEVTDAIFEPIRTPRIVPVR